MRPSVDHHPWLHPFLTYENIKAFREYSDEVKQFAGEVVSRMGYAKSIVFNDNLAQNMLKWTEMAIRFGIEAKLIPNPMDNAIISSPYWEYYDAEVENVFSSKDFDKDSAIPQVERIVENTALNGEVLIKFINQYRKTQLPADLDGVRRYMDLWNHEGCYPFFEWARRITKYDVSYNARCPIPAYASGKPYAAISVGGDLQFACGESSPYAQLLRKSFKVANFLMVSNPHTLGHSRRLGLSNGVHIPYPMDNDRYTPGAPKYRAEWEKQTNGNFFVLSTSRIDSNVKGQDTSVVSAITRVIQEVPGSVFVFINWGNTNSKFYSEILEAGLSKSTIFLPPVGKSRLIDYYRSCDVVIDQFVYGYFGATALEALSIGKPVIMNLREEHYGPLYLEDLPPINKTYDESSLITSLIKLGLSREIREEQGKLSREWILRNHGEKSAGVDLMNLLSMIAHKIPIPGRLLGKNPLAKPLTTKEHLYHQSLQLE